MIPIYLLDMHVPGVLPSNAKLFQYPFAPKAKKVTLGRGGKRWQGSRVRNPKPSDIGWLRHGDCSIPYIWGAFGKNLYWTRLMGCSRPFNGQQTALLGVKSTFGAHKFTIPVSDSATEVGYSSEWTAGSPPFPPSDVEGE